MQTLAVRPSSGFKYAGLLGLASASSLLATAPQVLLGNGPAAGVGFFLSTIALLFGAAPLRAVRIAFGSRLFWAGSLAVVGVFAAAGFVVTSVLVMTLAVLVGLFAEVDELGASTFWSGALGVLAALAVLGIAVGGWQSVTRADLIQELRGQLSAVADAVSRANPGTKVEVEALLAQVPSGIGIVLMLLLAAALAWEARMLSIFGLSHRSSGIERRLREFRVPDAAVWLVILAIPGAFLQHGVEWLKVCSMNLLNVLVVVYFFQGMAVVSSAFIVFRISPLWRGIWIALILVQLFIVVSLVGLVDYWLDLRERLARKPAEENESF